jgi:hypothetical protein
MKSAFETGRSEHCAEQMTQGQAAIVLTGFAPVGSKLWIEARAVFKRMRERYAVQDACAEAYHFGLKDGRKSKRLEISCEQIKAGQRS